MVINPPCFLLPFHPQAACFTAVGFIFMIMSLTFIALDWINGENRSGGGH